MTDEFKELQSVVREFCDGHLKSCAHTTVEMPESQGKQHLLVEIMKRIMALEEDARSEAEHRQKMPHNIFDR